MKLKTLVLSFFFVAMQGMAQTNGTYVSNITLDNHAEKWCWSISKDQNQLMYFGVSNGIVVYDGQTEVFIKTGYTPVILEFDESREQILVAGYQNIGFLSTSDYMKPIYQELNIFDDIRFTDAILDGNTACLISSGMVVCLNLETKEFVKVHAGDFRISGAFFLNKKLFAVGDYFVYQVQDSTLVEQTQMDFPVDSYSFITGLNEKEVLIGSEEGKLYLFNGKNYHALTLESNDFFENNLVVKARPYGDNKVLLSSVAGGAAILNTSTRSIVKRYSYYNGLPDDEIRAFWFNNDELWLSHGFGISRIDLNIGIEQYQFFPGLKGTPMSALQFENQLYVATTNGLYTLSEIRDYREFNTKVSEVVDIPVEYTVERPVVTNSDAEQNKTSRKKFSLFGRNKKEEETTEQKAATVETNEAEKRVQITRETRIRNVTRRSLKSISNYFTLVPGTSDKCRELQVVDNYLLVAGNSGLYAVKGGRSTTVLANVGVSAIYAISGSNRALCCTNDGLYFVWNEDGRWQKDQVESTSETNFTSIVAEDNNIWVATAENAILRFSIDGADINIKNQYLLKDNPGMVFRAIRSDGKTLIITDREIFEYTDKGELVTKDQLNDDLKVIASASGTLWTKHHNQWKRSGSSNPVALLQNHKLSLLGDIRTIETGNKNNLWVITEKNEIVKIEPKEKQGHQELSLRISGLKSAGKELNPASTIRLSASNNKLKGMLSCPYYVNTKNIAFYSLIENTDTAWNYLGANPDFSFSYLKPGRNRILFKAVDAEGNTSNELALIINQRKPFTQSIVFFLIVMAAITFGLWMLFKMRTIKLKKDKEILEQKVKERTQTIEEQKNKIERQHEDITHSIKYAERIQKAMLPNDEIMDAMLPEHFVLFMPRDIVSGDFYFFKPCGKHLVFAAADCTGHGVPGAFMSMLGISFLNEITTQNPHISAAEILNMLRIKIKLTLHQTDVGSIQKDGMDISICVIDPQQRKLQFSGAFNPLYIVRNNELESIKADRQPVAVYLQEKDFTNNEVEIHKGDMFYMFSDGYTDQIGGPQQRKFMAKNFKTLLSEIHLMPMEKQREILRERIEEWKGEEMQMDDILVTGFRL